MLKKICIITILFFNISETQTSNFFSNKISTKKTLLAAGILGFAGLQTYGMKIMQRENEERINSEWPALEDELYTKRQILMLASIHAGAQITQNIAHSLWALRGLMDIYVLDNPRVKKFEEKIINLYGKCKSSLERAVAFNKK